MIPLPSTTKVDRRLPKETLYRHMKLDAKQKDELVHGIERITVMNSIKASTVNLDDSADVHEILILRVELKRRILPKAAIEVIAKNNPHKLLFECIFERKEAYAVYRLDEIWFTQWCNSGECILSLEGESLSHAWNSYCAQVIFNSNDIKNVDAEIGRRRRLTQLDAEIAKLERQHGKEKQLARRNQLFRWLRQAKSEREKLVGSFLNSNED